MRTSVVVLVLLLTACAGGSSGVRFFIIDPVNSSPLRTTADGPLAVQIMDLQVPQYLERPRIASRTGDNELAFSQDNQWGDNLRKNLARTLARNLSDLLATPDVSSPFSRSTSAPDYRLLVFVEEFEQGADGHARVSARWQVIDGDSGATLLTQRAMLASASALPREHEVVVGVLRDLYGELSVRIAESLMQHMGGS